MWQNLFVCFLVLKGFKAIGRELTLWLFIQKKHFLQKDKHNYSRRTIIPKIIEKHDLKTSLYINQKPNGVCKDLNQAIRKRVTICFNAAFCNILPISWQGITRNGFSK